jgi:hypothetical protein
VDPESRISASQAVLQVFLDAVGYTDHIAAEVSVLLILMAALLSQGPLEVCEIWRLFG